MDDSDRIGVGSGLMRSNVVLSRGSLAMLADGERGILELIARGSDLRTTLDALVRMLEAQCQGMVCSIALLSADGLSLRHGAAPSLPRAFRDAIDGLPIGPDFGSCGSAIFNRAPVIVSDIATDPLWDRYRHFALPHGLRACWSTPIIGTGEEILGAFAIYYRMPARPSPQDQAIIAVATHLAAIAIGRDRSEQALRHSEARLSDIIRSTMNAVITFDREQTILLFNDAAARLFDCPASAAIGQRVTRFLPDLQAPVSRAIGQHDMRGYRDDGMTILVEAAISQADSAGETVFTALLRDVGERRRQEREIARLNRLYAVRSAVNQAIVRCRHGNGLLAEICRIIVEQGAFRMAWIGRHDPAEAAIRPVAVCGDTDGFLSGVTIRTDDGPLGGGPVGSAFRHGTTQIYNDFLKNPASLPWRDRARRFGIGAVAAFVIRQRGACWGTLAIYATETDCFQARSRRRRHLVRPGSAGR
jgi:PAS domain S-box-containing protein